MGRLALFGLVCGFAAWFPRAQAILEQDFMDKSAGDQATFNLRYPTLDQTQELEEYIGLTQNPYTTVPKGDWKYNALDTLGQKGLLGPAYDPNLFSNGGLTRMEMALMVENMVTNFLKYEDRLSTGLPIGPKMPDSLSKSAMTRKPGTVGELVDSDISGSAAIGEPVTLKDQTMLENLINDLKKELNEQFGGEISLIKDDVSELKKNLAKGKGFSLRNNSDFLQLRRSIQDEDDRAKWRGSEQLYFRSGGPMDQNQEVDFHANFNLNFTSKPQPQEDTLLEANFGFTNDFGRERSRFNVGNFNFNYVNFQRGKERLPKFYLRSLRYGDISFGWLAPLTLFNLDADGLLAQFQLNDQTIDVFGRRSKVDPCRSSEGDRRCPRYDTYTYGASMSGSLFDNPLGLWRISYLREFQDKDSFGGAPGTWTTTQNVLPNYEANSNYTEEEKRVIFPPTKNTVTSAWVRYPITKLAGREVFFTGEYATTTFSRPGYRFQKKPETPVNINDINTFTIIPRKQDTGEGMVVLLDWGKPPYQIFPMGFIRLNSGFNSRNLGLPGLDLNSLLNLGGLPLQINSLDVLVSLLNINRVSTDNYQASFVLADFKENRPINIDFPLVADGLGDDGFLLESVLDWLNTRTAKLHGSFKSAEGKYFLSDNANITVGARQIDVGAKQAFLDSAPIKKDGLNIIRDDLGNPIVNVPGDGVIDGQETTDSLAASLDLKFRIINHHLYLNWDFAKRKASYEFKYDRDQFLNRTQKPSELANGDIIEALESGTTHTVSHNMTYRLSNSTDVQFRYRKTFDKYPPDRDPVGDVGKGNKVDDSDQFETWVTTRF